jgi:hypothetical protein
VAERAFGQKKRGGAARRRHFLLNLFFMLRKGEWLKKECMCSQVDRDSLYKLEIMGRIMGGSNPGFELQRGNVS